MRVSKRLIGLTEMSDIVQRRIPVLALESGQPGPAVWLTACIHGDEAGGTVIVHEVFDAVRKSGLLRGTLHALPLVNPIGFENVSRYINAEREDLNRCFPGQARGTMGEQIAKRLFETIAKTEPALVIDLHNDWIHSVPYILIEPTDVCASKKVHREALRAATATELVLVEDTGAREDLSRTLTGSMATSGVPAFTIEAGGAGGIVEESVSAGKAAIMAVLRLLEMAPGERERRPRRTPSELLRYTNRPLSTSSGLVRFSVAAGDRIEKDAPIARVYSAVGACEETLRARGPGIVLGLTDHARVMPGSEVIAIAELAA